MKEGWEYKKLGDVTTFINGFAFKSSLFTKEGEKILRISNIQNDIVDLSDVVFFNKETYKQNLDKYKVHPDDILIALSGATTGKIGINKTNETLYLNQRVAICRESVKTLSHKYLYCFLKTKSLEFLKDAEGVAQPNLSTEQMKNYVLPIPPLSEQQHIVEELDLLSSIIEKKKAQLNELDNMAQSLFYEMFGDPITNEKGWEVIRLGDKCSVSSFKRVLIEDVVDKGIPFIRGTELMALANGDDVDFTLFITPEHYEVVKEISDIPKIGDLLIPSINAKGCIWIVNTDHPRYYKDGRVLWVHVDANSYTSETLKFIMSLLIKETYSAVASGATFAELKLFVLRDLQTILPPLPLQQQFASKIEVIEHQKELIKQSIKEVETLFNSRMDYYFN